MFYQIFLSPQAKRCAIITDKHGMYKLPNELPNNLRLIWKVSKPHRMISQRPVPSPKRKPRHHKQHPPKNRNQSPTAAPPAMTPRRHDYACKAKASHPKIRN